MAPLRSSRRALRSWSRPRGRAAALLLAFAGVTGLTAAGLTVASAQEEPPETRAVKGTLKGTDDLRNPVWEEAADPENQRFTFRQPSATVSKEAKVLTPYLPKEVAIVATGGAKRTGTEKVTVSGGRTTPVMIVLATGQNVQFVNADPFPHTLYETQGDQGGLPPEEMKPNTQRTWQPPGAGVYEIRDQRFPSIRSWIVVADDVTAVAYPDPKGEFVVDGLVPGSYTLDAYFTGQKIGSLPAEVKPFGPLQPLPKPLEVKPPSGGGGEKE